MGERYVQLKVYDTMYTEESAPVIIAAAALLKDTTNNSVLAQVKLKNITTSVIKALTLAIIPYSTEGNHLGEPVDHLYLDLNEARDSVFGQKEPIHLPENSTRQIEIVIKKVVFEDNTAWEASSQRAWTPLAKPELLYEHFNDEELAKQYILEYGEDSKVFPMQTNNLWFCKCGAMNFLDENTCHVCNAEQNKLFGFNLETLVQKKDDRLIEYAEEQAAIKEKAQQEKERLIKRLKIIIPCVVVAIAALAVFFGVIQPRIEMAKRYERAVARLKEKKYDQAVSLFNTTLGYKNTSKYLKQAEKGAKEQELYMEVETAYRMPLSEAIRDLASVSDLSEADQEKLEFWRELSNCVGTYQGTKTIYTGSDPAYKKNYKNTSTFEMDFSVTSGEAYIDSYFTDSIETAVSKSNRDGYNFEWKEDGYDVYFSKDKLLYNHSSNYDELFEK